MSDDKIYLCSICWKEKLWYKFKFPIVSPYAAVCFKCEGKRFKPEQHLEYIYIENRLKRLSKMAEKQNMTTLRTHLFEVIEMVKNKEIDIDQAKMICEAAQVIVNSAKVEVDFIKAIGGQSKSQFLQIEQE